MFLLFVSFAELAAKHHNISTFSLAICILSLHIIYSLIFFEGSAFFKIIWPILFSVLALISHFISVLISIELLHYAGAEVVDQQGSVRISFAMLYILILSMFIFVFIFIGIKTIHLAKRQIIFTLIISITCVTIEQMDFITIANLAANQEPARITSISIFFLVFFLYFCVMFYIYNLGMQKERNVKLITENLFSKINQIQYKQIISSTESLRGIKHDISNHLKTLSLLISSNEYEKAKEYIDTISSEIAANYKLISTGNIPIDCIISDKYTLANNKDITFDYTIHLPQKMPIDDVSICSLLGNILDNAIESCEKLSCTEKKSISLMIKPFNNMLLITATNSSTGDYKLNKSGKLLTTKQNTTEQAYHGIGMNQIYRIVKGKKGFIRISPEADSFSLEIMIPLKNE